jgi:hypothetical protein
MEITIRILKKIRKISERNFIDNSIIVMNSNIETTIPDTKQDLQLIAELNQSISILENDSLTKNNK